MSKKISLGINDLLALFEPSLDSSDIIEAKLMSKVSLAITNERLRLGMSQARFAEHIGVQQSMVSRWEKGDYNFTIRKIAEIAAKLGINADISFSNSNIFGSIKQTPIARPVKSKNVYFFDEYKKAHDSFKSATYTDRGWNNAAVR